MNNDNNLPLVLHHYLGELEKQLNFRPFHLNAIKRQASHQVQLPTLPAEILPLAGPDETETSLNSQLISADNDYEVNELYTGLVRSFKSAIPLIVGLWVHGSLSTKDYTPYSDVDLLLVIKDQVINHVQLSRKVQTAVQKALKHMLLFDPLQHHGIMIGVEKILNFWPSAYLPLPALENARPLWQPARTYHMRCLNDHKTNIIPFRDLYRNLLRAGTPNTLYQVKSLLSRFMLLPAAYYQAINQPMYKRESFVLASQDFKAYWRPLDEATRMRSQWVKPHPRFWKLLLSISSPWVASRIYRQFERNIPELSFYDDWVSFTSDMKRLAIFMDEKITD